MVNTISALKGKMNEKRFSHSTFMYIELGLEEGKGGIENRCSHSVFMYIELGLEEGVLETDVKTVYSCT